MRDQAVPKDDNDKPRVLVTQELPSPGAAALVEAGFDVVQCRSGNRLEDDLAELLPLASALIATLSETIDAELIASAPHLKVISNIAMGYDNIDLQAAANAGIVVTNTPEVLTEATADMAWALLLSAARRVVEGDKWVRSGTWTGWEPTQMLGSAVGGKTISIIGMGRIGAAIARRAGGFGMTVLSSSRTPKPELEASVGATRTEIDEALAVADFVVLVTPLNESTYHLIDEGRLSLMKPTATLINIGRGPVVDETALVNALSDGQIASAALDVYEFEPKVSSALRELPNVVLAPHLGSATHETRAKMVEICCENIEAVLNGSAPITPVELPHPS